MRRDAARNRERLLAAARQVFAERGPDVPLEEVARVAEVSRTTLYRNFATREELALTVYEDNVIQIEERAAGLTGKPDGVVELLDFVVDMLQGYRNLAPVISGAIIGVLTGLATRTEAAFTPLVERGREAGIMHPDADVADVMLAIGMAEAGLARNADWGGGYPVDRVRPLLHRALFTISRDR
jgi:AcrR family transcriptional regulator